MPATLERVSFSALAQFSKCGEQYRRRRIVGESDPTSLPTVAGSAFHEAAEWFECNDGLKMPVPQQALANHAKHLLRETEGVRELRYFGKQDLKWWCSTGLEDIAGYYVEHRKAEVAKGFSWLTARVPSTEIKVEVKFADDLPVLVGYIDQTYYDHQHRLVIRDLKTGKPKSEHAIQLNLYALAFQLLNGVDVSYCTALYLKGKAEQKVTIPTLSLDAAANMLRRYVNSVEQGIFPFSGPWTDSCGLCPYQSDCPAGRALDGSNVLPL